MIQIDIPFAAAMGAGAAAAAKVQLRAGTRADFYRTWLETNLFLIFGFSWIPVFFLLNYFGWETTHLWWTAASVTAYPWFIPAAMVLLFAFGNAGFLIGARLVATDRAGANRVFYLGVLVACLTWLVAFYPRTMKLGTADTWETAPWVYQDPAFVRAWALSTAVWFGSFGALTVRLARRGRGSET
jgi:hypothetical protein